MIRKIIKIDSKKCNGCGACAKACHEGAIDMIDGKAVLTREDYCDGLGDCLPTCPTNAISFEMREAPEYNEAAVKENQAKKKASAGCPGSRAMNINHDISGGFSDFTPSPSRLTQWPVQIKLAPINAPYFDNAELLIAADCTAYAYGNFHNDFIKNKITLIGCPKLDNADYSEKLSAIISNNNIKSITVVKMEVPCCNGIEIAVKNALQITGKSLPCRVVTISTNGKIL